MDRWIRSRLHSTLRDATDALENFDAFRATQAIDALVDDVSNWYVRRSRPRFWKASDGSAHAVLHECLVLISQMLAPVCPFTADELFQNLTGSTRSVHLSNWPDPDASAIDPELDAEMSLARELVSLGLAARAESKLKVRQPLPRAIVMVPEATALRSEIVTEIADALNVKTLETVTSLEGLLDYTVVPNFRALGPKVGKLLPKVKQLLADADGASVREALATAGTYSLDVDGTVVALTADDLEIRAASHESLALTQAGPLAVAIDTTLTPALRREGLAREIVRALNDHRKAIGLAIADRIELRMDAFDDLLDALTDYQDWIAVEVLATSVTLGATDGEAHTLTVDGHSLRVTTRKVDG